MCAMAPSFTDVNSMFDLRGRVAVVTGGGGALCGVMATALASVGVRVAVVDQDLARAERVVQGIRERDDQALAFACDVLDRDGLERLAEALRAQWGAPDLLINGAGGNHPAGSTAVEFLEPAATTGGFFDLPVAGVEATFDLNFLGTLLPTQVLARAMVARGKGAVLNIASMSSLTPLTKVGAYSAAKAAVANFTRWLAVHLARTGVRVNALAPGFFMTDQLRFLHTDQRTGEPTMRSRQVIAHTPLGRYGEPEDLVGAMLWLLSDASRFVTGNVVAIDGGFSAYSI
jgi:NAD(P)-dependent dehydrogenase (short-subunit alcohol dehydrogenase family)